MWSVSHSAGAQFIDPSVAPPPVGLYFFLEIPALVSIDNRCGQSVDLLGTSPTTPRKKIIDAKRAKSSGPFLYSVFRVLFSFRRFKFFFQLNYFFATTLPSIWRLHGNDFRIFGPMHGWFRTAKNRDVSNGPFACPLTRSLTPLTHSLAPHCSLRSRAPLRSFVRSLAHSLAPELMGKWFMSLK